MPQTPKSKLRYPASSDSANTWTYWQNLAEDLDGRVITKVSSQGQRDALSASNGDIVARTDTGDIEAYYSGAWNRIAGPLIQGKMWRTSGFSASIPVDTPSKVAFDASRVTGGITFSNSGDTLTVPRSGFYDIQGRGYATGGTASTFSYTAVRQRSGVSDLEIILSNRGRKIDAEDEVVYLADKLPLQSGDALYLRVTFKTNPGVYWGATEFTGVFLSATFLAPLYGAAVV